MGLLEKAIAYRKRGGRNGRSAASYSAGSGLLARASAFRSGKTPSPSIPAFSSPRSPLEMGKGLLARALFFRNLTREKKREEEGISSARKHPPPGLFQRAQKFRDELDLLKGSDVSTPPLEPPSSWTEPAAIESTEPAWSPEELTLEETPIEEPAAMESTEPAWSPEELALEETPVEEPTPEEEVPLPGKGLLARAEEEARRQEEESAQETDLISAEEEFPEFPEYEGSSLPEEDPALDGHLERQSESAQEDLALTGDPFDQWEIEAEREAEKFALATTEGEGESTQSREDFLFDENELDFATRPQEEYLASPRKIDNYLTLFDITRELTSIDDFDEMWETLLFSIMGQPGTEKICFFSSKQAGRGGDLLYPVIHRGFDLPDGWTLKEGDEIYDRLKVRSGARYAKEMRSAPLSPVENSILDTVEAELLIPVRNGEHLLGIMVLGPPMSGGDYSTDDMEFLGMLGELSAAGVERALSRTEFEEKTASLSRKAKVQDHILALARKSSSVKNLDGVYDLLSEVLTEEFFVDSFSLVLLSPGEQEYRIFGGNRLSPESLERFSLPVNSDLVGTVSNLTRIYELNDFRENREIRNSYTNDDIALMNHFWILPLINLNWLVGFVTIHRTSRAWTDFHREMAVSLAEVIAPVIANALILTERESVFRDPFSPLEDRLRQEMKRATEFHAAVSLVELRIKNIQRLFALNPPEEVTEYLSHLTRIIGEFLFDTDYLSRIGQGRFALILPGRTRHEAELFSRKVLAELRRQNRLVRSPVEVQFSHSLSTFPEDTSDPERMLSLLN